MQLQSKGYDIGSYEVDGAFGENAKQAVVRFQRDYGLDAELEFANVEEQFKYYDEWLKSIIG